MVGVRSDCRNSGADTGIKVTGLIGKCECETGNSNEANCSRGLMDKALASEAGHGLAQLAAPPYYSSTLAFSGIF